MTAIDERIYIEQPVCSVCHRPLAECAEWLEAERAKMEAKGDE